jgi:GNAT superfamily N-acetyltransferase
MSDSSSAGVSLREATIADCAAVARVHVRSWQESFRGIVPQSFLDRMSVEKRAVAFEKRFPESEYRMFVAEEVERGVVGFADFGEAREQVEGYEGELYAIYLLPEFQRRGVGRRLFNLGAEFLLSRGRRSMYLLALEASPYRTFYERLGGRVIGRTRIEIEGVPFEELIYGWRSLA